MRAAWSDADDELNQARPLQSIAAYLRFHLSRLQTREALWNRMAQTWLYQNSQSGRGKRLLLDAVNHGLFTHNIAICNHNMYSFFQMHMHLQVSLCLSLRHSVSHILIIASRVFIMSVTELVSDGLASRPLQTRLWFVKCLNDQIIK